MHLSLHPTHDTENTASFQITLQLMDERGIYKLLLRFPKRRVQAEHASCWNVGPDDPAGTAHIFKQESMLSFITDKPSSCRSRGPSTTIVGYESVRLPVSQQSPPTIGAPGHRPPPHAGSYFFIWQPTSPQSDPFVPRSSASKYHLRTSLRTSLTPFSSKHRCYWHFAIECAFDEYQEEPGQGT